MLPVYALLHDILSPAGVMILGLPIFLGIGLIFGFIGVSISRKYGPASLALSTGAFCFAVMVLWGNSSGGDPGGLILVPIVGGITQGIVIARRTRDGKGRTTAVEALIGSGAFVVGTIVAGIAAAVVLS